MRLRWYTLSRNPLFLFSLAGLIFIFIQIITMGSTPTEDDHFLARAVQKQLSDASVLNYGYLKEKSSEMPYSVRMRMMPERKHERDVITYQTFTKDAVYHLEKGIRGTIRTNLQKYQPDAFDELQEVIVHGAHLLRSEELQTYQMPPEHVLENMGTKYSDFISGVVRTERNRGTHYELLFKDSTSTDFSSPEQSSKHSIKKIELFRPFAPIQHVRTETINPSELIHFVLPLSGRVEMFTHFIGVFLNSAVGLNDQNNAVNIDSVYLSIVYFGEGIETIRAILQKYVASFPGFTNYRILVGEGEFSRGKGLHKGIVTPLGPEFTSFDHGLLFFIDVDIGFTKDILELCRSYTIPGKSVYYPIVFSMYNPAIVGVRRKKKTSDNSDEDDDDDDSQKKKSQVTMHQDFGYWRHFGYGMTCQYREDYLKVGGFNLTIEGWGMEDIELYRNYVSDNYKIVRSPTKGIIHYWHEKQCDPNVLAKPQMLACLKSLALNEGSQVALGLTLFKERMRERQRSAELQREGKDADVDL